MPKIFLEHFVFIWGHEECSKMSNQISLGSHNYLKDLKRMYYACLGLPYGKEDQTLLIVNEPSKTFRNLKWSGLFLESINGQMLSKNKVQCLDLASCLWPLILELPIAKTIQLHYDHMVKYSKPHLSLFLKNYYWFLQYIDNDNGDVLNNQPSIGIMFESFHFVSYFFCYDFLKLVFVFI
jgi:hypothetical protein